MKKMIEVCDGCEEEMPVLYVCSKCKQSFCEDCIIEHLLDENIIEEKSFEKY